MCPPRNDFIAAAEVHLDLHKQAYGTRYVKPKHHYVFHNAEQEPKELDCFVAERHNKMAKARHSLPPTISKTDKVYLYEHTYTCVCIYICMW